ncbi:MAG: UDP-N-acetylmuramoyl-L-alanine--D-glutamate ligase [Rickettsiales bacterium]|nr:MAG: UDP-N-acetylmuramoyl-L-alanine--D-glutamate ligase [Rickettsiales bacterium]
MKLISQAKQKIGIFGLGLTGQSVYEALLNIADLIICWDDSEKNRNAFSDNYNQNDLVDITCKSWLELDKIVISPGVPHIHPIFLLAKNHNILISSDIQLFLEENKNSKIVAITGTNGKSTTTALVGHLLKSNNYDYHVGGNIGVPILQLPVNAQGYILELSSFQLDLLYNFNPDIAVLLNITPDHFDRYANFEAYVASKFKVFNGDGVKIISIDTPILKDFYFNLKAKYDKKVISISTNPSRYGIVCTSHTIKDNVVDKKKYDIPIFDNLLGNHNLENIAAAFAVCKMLGLTSQQIIRNLGNFQGLKHRMQYLGKKNHIKYYNDSKATNATSAAVALNTLSNIYWLAGGIFKEESFAPIDHGLASINRAYLFGKDKMLFAEYLENKVKYDL